MCTTAEYVRTGAVVLSPFFLGERKQVHAVVELELKKKKQEMTAYKDEALT